MEGGLLGISMIETINVRGTPMRTFYVRGALMETVDVLRYTRIREDTLIWISNVISRLYLMGQR